MENADGSITYMLLSLNGGNELRVNVGAGDSEATPTGRGTYFAWPQLVS